MKIPEGWPTEEMIRAFKKVFRQGTWNEGVIAGIKAALAAAPTPVLSIGDDDLRMRWRLAGGKFHGPNVETGYMPEENLLPFLRSLVAPAPPVQHPDDEAVDRFAIAMKEKLAASRAKGRSGWDDPKRCGISHLQFLLNSHVAKGDPVDVGNLVMMLHQRGGKTTPPAQESALRDWFDGTEDADGNPLPTDEEILAFIGEEFDSGEVAIKTFRAIQEYLIERLVPPEPTATVINNNQPGWTNIVETKPHVTLPVGAKLYTRPANDGLREAAEEAYVLLTDVDQQMNLNTDCKRIMKNLRAALEKKS